MRGRETPNQEAGFFKSGTSKQFCFLVEFLLLIGNSIETVAAFLVRSVGKFTSGRGADVRIFSRRIFLIFFLIPICFAC